MSGYAIVLASKDLERIQAVSIIGSVAAASDVPVDVFVTMDGLRAFENETVDELDWERGPVGEAMLEADAAEVPLFFTQFAQAKEIGPLSVYACSMAMELMGNTLEDYVDVFDDELGVAGFLNRAADKQVIFV